MTRLCVLLCFVGVLVAVGGCVSAQEQSAPTVAGPRLPKPKLKSTDTSISYYPDAELRHGHTGYVLLEYSIDTRGRPSQVSVLESTGVTFSENATHILSGSRYEVAANWSSAGGPTQRFKIQFHFVIRGYPNQGGHSGIEDIVISGNPSLVQH